MGLVWLTDLTVCSIRSLHAWSGQSREVLQLLGLHPSLLSPQTQPLVQQPLVLLRLLTNPFRTLLLRASLRTRFRTVLLPRGRPERCKRQPQHPLDHRRRAQTRVLLFDLRAQKCHKPCNSPRVALQQVQSGPGTNRPRTLLLEDLPTLQKQSHEERSHQQTVRRP